MKPYDHSRCCGYRFDEDPDRPEPRLIVIESCNEVRQRKAVARPEPVQYKRENPNGLVKQIAATMHTPPGVAGVVKFCPLCGTRHASPLPIGCQNCGTTL